MSHGYRLQVANWAIRQLAPQVRALGERVPAAAFAPALIAAHIGDFHLFLTIGVLPHPGYEDLHETLEIFMPDGPKVFSATWIPQKPWIPPEIINFKPGDWYIKLGY